MSLKITVTSNRKKMKRRFRSKRLVDRYLKMALPRETKQIVKQEVRNRLSGRAVSGGRINPPRVSISPAKGWIKIYISLKLPDTEAITSGSMWAAGQKSWLSGDTMVLEIPEGHLYRLQEALGKKAEEARNALEGQNRGSVVQIQRALHESIFEMLQNSQSYKKRVRKVLDKVTKDLSLANV